VQPLAVATPKRIPTLPNVPTFAEAGMPEFEYDAWFGIMAPANTPAAIRDKVSQDVATILRMPDVQKRLESQGVVTIVSAPARVRRVDPSRHRSVRKNAQAGGRRGQLVRR
jgi:tripartite-type tricarboxylate transporter receptor subunit TctC